jgi:hypothetical protein
MPSYRIHRLKDHLHQSFRLAPHVSGTAHVKPRDYEAVEPGEPVESIEAATPYAAFFALKETEGPLLPGDLLEAENGALRIYKFVGFEEAQWLLPEAKPESAAEAVLATSTVA